MGSRGGREAVVEGGRGRHRGNHISPAAFPRGNLCRRRSYSMTFDLSLFWCHKSINPSNRPRR